MLKRLAKAKSKPEIIIQAIAERQEELSALEARLRAAKAAPEAISLELRRMEAEAKKRVADLRALLDRNPEEARRTMAAVFNGPITFTPVETTDGPRYRLEGQAVVGRVLTGEFPVSNVASPAGFEPALQP